MFHRAIQLSENIALVGLLLAGTALVHMTARRDERRRAELPL